jgi:mRNA interferase MazF
LTNQQLSPGDVLWADLPAQDPRYHEQEGRRPVVIAGTLPRGARFPLLVIVPLTSQSGPWRDRCPELYPIIPDGSFAVPGEAVALVDQVRAIDRRRLGRFLGTLAPDRFAPIVAGLRVLLRL